MRLLGCFRLALHDVWASKFSLCSNVLAIFIGVGFFTCLLSLTLGVSAFLERYYTRTMALTTLLVFYNADAHDSRPFTTGYRREIVAQPGVAKIVYHDIDFAELAIVQGRSVTAALRTGIAADPEVARLEFVAGGNLPEVQDPARPPVVISMARATRLSELPPRELIGTEVAITFQRSMKVEEEPQRESLYGQIVGIVHETPDESVYVPYSVLAAASAWQKTLAKKAERSKTPLTETDVAGMYGVSWACCWPGLRPEIGTVLRIVASLANPVVVMADQREPSGQAFAFAHIKDAFAAVQRAIDEDTITYPHMRLHMNDVSSLLDLRARLRSAGVTTSSVLDDIAAVRELTKYIGWTLSTISGITVLAALCSIFNTLLASVERRTREIGILISLGASTVNILSIFLYEAAILGLGGSALAAGVMYFVTARLNSWVLTRFASSPEFQRVTELQPSFFSFPWWLPLATLGVGVFASLFAACVPALRACRIQPSEALRHA